MMLPLYRAQEPLEVEGNQIRDAVYGDICGRYRLTLALNRLCLLLSEMESVLQRIGSWVKAHRVAPMKYEGNDGDSLQSAWNGGS